MINDNSFAGQLLAFVTFLLADWGYCRHISLPFYHLDRKTNTWFPWRCFLTYISQNPIQALSVTIHTNTLNFLDDQ